ncbi:hypothetical protein GBA52_024853 [Prunus armeniaca]|nr:hypothetical protein GBA52_024853 [Prunus armeniaca]
MEEKKNEMTYRGRLAITIQMIGFRKLEWQLYGAYLSIANMTWLCCSKIKEFCMSLMT